jgi:hypothetical protein
VLDQVQARVGFLNKLLIPKLVNSLFSLAYDRPEDAVGTIGETFRNTVFRGNLFSSGFGIRREDVRRVISEAIEINKRIPMAGVLSLRFVKGTQATLGFTRWEKSCVMEIDGADAKITHDFVHALSSKLKELDIPFTFHWGKINRVMDKTLVDWMYGADTIRKWKEQRSRVMSHEVQQVFNNEFMERCGLDEFIPHPDSSTDGDLIV